MLFRKSNLIPDTLQGFQKHKQLTHADCVRTQDQVVVGIRWAKNEQFRRDLLTFPLPKLGGSVLCPVDALDNVRRLVKHNENDHIFKVSDNASFTYRQFQDKLQETLKQLQVPNYASYSSHSFRRGGTTFSFLCGIPVEIIKLLGNWRSNAFLSYIEFPLETRSAACELMKMRILAMEQKGHK